MKFNQHGVAWIDADDRYKLTQGIRGWDVWWRSNALGPHNRVARELLTFAAACGAAREHQAEAAKLAYLV